MDSLASQLLAKVAVVLGVRAGQLQLQPIPTGLTNRSFKVEHNGRISVVRINDLRAAELGVNREFEICALRYAESVGIAPHIVHVDPEFLVTEFVDGLVCSGDDGTASEALPFVAEAIRAFHGGERLGAELFAPIERAREHRSMILIAGGDFPAHFDEAFKLAEKLEMKLARTVVHSVPAHVDLTPQNVLLVDRRSVVFVDWECARDSDPAYDLGKFAYRAKYTREQTAEFAERYLGRRNAHWVERVLDQAAAATFLSAVWQLHQSYRHHEEKRLTVYRETAEKRLEEFRARMDAA